MTGVSAPAAGSRGFVHEAALYGDEDEFLAIVVPFLAAGTEAGEPALAAVGPERAALIRAELDDPQAVLFPDAHYLRPAGAVRAYLELCSSLVAEGARRIRAVGEVPHPGTGHPWDWWARYEAAINHAFAHIPLWGVCPYDTRITPDDVLTDVLRTHPRLATADRGHVPNAGFEDPVEFLRTRHVPCTDPLEAGPPVAEVVNSPPAVARQAVRDAGRDSGLDETDLADFVYAVSEAVTNALCHGVPPVRLRLWSGRRRMAAAVTDRGPGPADPFAGLLPRSPGISSAGTGLWLVHQVCSHVTLGRDDEGFTIRLVAGTLAA